MTADAGALPHLVEQVLDIDADREVVFRFFTDTPRWASWWGPGSTIDPRPRGEVFIRFPGGAVEVKGEVLEIEAPSRIVFTYGFVSGTPIPAGSSRVTIRLEDLNGSTRLHLQHAFAEAGVRDEHVQGWRYQLSLFSNLVYNEIHANAGELARAWYSAWSAADASSIEASLRPIASPRIRMRDRFSSVEGLDGLIAHIAAARKFMPGLSMEAAGDVRQCQGVALSDWVAKGPDGAEKARGTNVFMLGSDGRIHSVTGFWS
jgi:uncharacterized protein YndB with AHSA1/START domain